MMIRKMAIAGLVAAIGLGLVSEQAYAWGPRAQQVITSVALEVVREEFFMALKSVDTSYDNDLLRGALDGSKVLADASTVTSETEAALAVATEIQLLRAVRKYGIGSYFSYRMGLLSALVSDMLMPYGLSQTPTGAVLKRQIEADIDAHLDQYAFEPRLKDRYYVRDAQEYLFAKRTPFEHATPIIAGDYRTGIGYDGYLKQGAEVFFNNAIYAVADISYTILRPEGDVTDVPSSAQAGTYYFVNEIAYLLKVKGNRGQAERTYRHFIAVNPGILEAYEQVGDLFYEFGLKERGVSEWRTAITFSGPGRQRAVKKLANHYLEVGKEGLGRADLELDRRDDALMGALEGFTQALEYDRTNVEAADFLAKTREVIRDREERRELDIGIMASAEDVMKEAEIYKTQEDYGNALITYNRARTLLENIDDEFPEMKQVARDRVAQVKKEVTRIINKLLEQAQEAISQGDRSLDDRRFDVAAEHYNRVEVLLGLIPASEETGTYGEEKKQLSEKARDKIRTVQIEKRRWTEQQRQQPQEQAQQEGEADTAP